MACEFKEIVLHCKIIDNSITEIRNKVISTCHPGKDRDVQINKKEEVLARFHQAILDLEEKLDAQKQLLDEVFQEESTLVGNIDEMYKKLKSHLTSIETHWKKHVCYVPYHEQLNSDISCSDSSYVEGNEFIPRIEVTSPGSQPLEEKACNGCFSITTGTQTPAQSKVPIKDWDSAQRSRATSAKKPVQQTPAVPDWVCKGTDISFTPGLFPRGPATSITSKNASKHLKF